MMKNLHPPVALYLAAAVLGASVAILPACNSPLRNDEAQRSLDRVNASLVAQAVADDNFAAMAIQNAPTYNAGVRELTPVSYLASTPPASPQAATQSTNTANFPPLTTLPANVIGVDAATLHLPEPARPLSLQSAIARTLAHSVDIKFNSYNPGIKETLIVQAEAAFDPIVFGQSLWSETDEPGNSIIVPTNGQTLQNQLGVKRVLPTGGQIQIAANANYHAVANPAPDTTGNSDYQNNISLQFNQPLLRGFGIDVNYANIYLAQKDRGIALTQFKRTVIKDVGDAETAYLQVVQAYKNVQILQGLYEKSQDTQKRVHAREPIDATSITLGQVDSAVLSNGRALSQAMADYRTASDKLKGLLNDPEFNISENTLIIPTDEPVEVPIEFSVPDIIQTALRQRTELTEARLDVEKTDIQKRVDNNGLLPKLNFTAGMQTNGLEPDLDRSFGMSVSGQFIDFNAGVTFEIPLGNRAAQAAYRMDTLAHDQALTNIVSLAQQIVTDVKTNLRSVLDNFNRLTYDVQLVQEEQRVLDGLNDRLKTIEKNTPEELQLILDTESQLAQDQQQLLQDAVNYNLSILQLEQAKGTLLEYNRISIGRAPVVDDINNPWIPKFVPQELKK